MQSVHKAVSQWPFKNPQQSMVTVDISEVHGDEDDSTTTVTAVMALHFMTDTAVIAGMGTAFAVPLRQRRRRFGKPTVAVTE